MAVPQAVLRLQPVDDLHVRMLVEAVGRQVEPVLDRLTVSLLDARKVRGGAGELLPRLHGWCGHARHAVSVTEAHTGLMAELIAVHGDITEQRVDAIV